MKQGWKWIKWMVLVIAAWHLTATLVYTAQWPAQGVLAQSAYRYMVPHFHQNWSLFAPNIPEYDAQLMYRVSNNDSLMLWTPWQDVSAASGYDDFSKMEVIEQNILVQLNYQLYSNYYSINGVPQLDAMVKTAAYNKALYYAGRMHEKNQGPWQMIQIAVLFRFPSDSLPIERCGSDTLIFPPYNYSDIKR
jgi:hypothetical protein